MSNVYQLKAGQDDFKDLRVIKEAKEIVKILSEKIPHTILVWEGCQIKDQLQKAFEKSKDSFEQNIEILENKTVEENFIVLMNKNAQVIECIEIQWES